MKRVVSLVLTMLLLLSLTSSIVLAEDKVTIKVVYHSSGQTEQTRKLHDQFMQEHPNIEIVMDEIPVASIMSQVSMMFASGSCDFDVINCQAGMKGAFAPAGYITPIDDLIAADNFDTSIYADAFAVAAKIPGDDRWWGLPWRCDVKVFLYNEEMYREAGIEQPPTTWADVLENAKKLTKDDQYGFVITGARGLLMEYFTDYLVQTGNRVFDEHGEPLFNVPEAVEMIEFYKSILPYCPSGTLNYDHAAANTDFAQGKVAQHLMWNYAYAEASDPSQSAIVGNVGTGLPPKVSEFHSRTGGWGLMINSESAHKQEAFEYIKWATSPAVERQVILNGGDCNPVCNTSLVDADVIAKAPIIGTFADILNAGSVFAYPSFPEISEMQGTIEDWLSKALAGEVDPQTAVNEMEAACQKILE